MFPDASRPSSLAWQPTAVTRTYFFRQNRQFDIVLEMERRQQRMAAESAAYDITAGPEFLFNPQFTSSAKVRFRPAAKSWNDCSQFITEPWPRNAGFPFKACGAIGFLGSFLFSVLIQLSCVCRDSVAQSLELQRSLSGATLLMVGKIVVKNNPVCAIRQTQRSVRGMGPTKPSCVWQQACRRLYISVV